MRIVLFLLVIISVCSCNEQTVGDKPTEIIIPELLDRSSGLTNSLEWDQIQNNYASARKKLNNNPDNINAYITLSGLFMTEARISGEHGHYFPGALHLINHALELNPSRDERFVLKSYQASVLLSQHQFRDALHSAKEGIRLNPRNAQVYGALVDAHVELGEYQDAVVAADKMVSMRPDLRSYSRVSYVRQIYGDLEGAINAMKLAIQAGIPGQEDRSWAMLTLGELYEDMGRLDEARYIYSSILEERENYPFAIGAIAWLDVHEGNLSAAEKGFKKAASIIPEVDFYVGLAEIKKQQLGKSFALNSEFKSMLTTIQEMYNDDVIHGHDMDMSFVDLHLSLTENLDEALMYGLKEYNKRPDNIDVNKMLAIIYYKRKDFNLAKKHMKMSCLGTCAGSEVKALSGLLLYQDGHKQEAINVLTELKQLNSDQHHYLVQETEHILKHT